MQNSDESFGVVLKDHVGGPFHVDQLAVGEDFDHLLGGLQAQGVGL